MSEYYQALADKLNEKLADFEVTSQVSIGELNVIVNKDDVLEVSTILRDDEELAFDTIIDVCGVDYHEYQGKTSHPSRFSSVYHLQSVSLNHRIRMICYLDSDMPIIDSVVGVWQGANWFEREAFDLFGILYNGHPDLRRILTDYGFIGNPLRKDFPMIGHVEMRYDHEKNRVVYEPVSIEERVNIPRVIRDDHRYEGHEE